MLQRVIVGIVVIILYANFIFLWEKDLGKAMKSEIKHSPPLCSGLQNMVWKKLLKHSRVQRFPSPFCSNQNVFSLGYKDCNSWTHFSTHISLDRMINEDIIIYWGSVEHSFSVWARLMPLCVQNTTGETIGNAIWVERLWSGCLQRAYPTSKMTLVQIPGMHIKS